MESPWSPYGHPKGRTDANGNWVTDVVSDPAFKSAAPFELKLPFDSTTPDGAVLYTVPTGKRLLVEQAYWEITTPFTGGSSSAIGVSSDVAPHDTKGDILGGATGDVAATLVAGQTQGTIGASFSAAPKLVVLEPGAKIRFDRITSAFTAGAGFLHLIGRLLSV